MRLNPTNPESIIIDKADVEIIHSSLVETAGLIEVHAPQYKVIIEYIETLPDEAFPVEIKDIKARYILGALCNSQEAHGSNSPAGNLLQALKTPVKIHKKKY